MLIKITYSWEYYENIDICLVFGQWTMNSLSSLIIYIIARYLGFCLYKERECSVQVIIVL